MRLKSPPFLVFYFFLLTFSSFSQTQSGKLLRSTPEKEGASSKGILNFINAVDNSKHEMHSIMILKHGKVIAEGWWNPYQPELKHSLYSLSKSFTSTAIGFAIGEGKLKADDKVISFFSGQLPDSLSENLKEMRIKDLLSMSAGQDPEPSAIGITDDWVKGFLKMPVKNKPGSVFLYNSFATYMLSAIVQKVTGQKIIEYLKPRLLAPLGIKDADWETDPKGINVGGWGLRVHTEDIARFGQLYLQKGKWNGKQVLPAGWANEATTFKIDNSKGAPQSKRDSSDWMQGYCYQFWRSRHNSFRGDGAFGQYCLVIPEADAVIAITSETSDMQGELNLVWQYLLPALRAGKTATAVAETKTLQARLKALRLPVFPPQDSVFTSTYSLNYDSFSFAPNNRKLESLKFTQSKSDWNIYWKQDGVTYQFTAGRESWRFQETNMLGPSLVAQAKNHFEGLPPSKIASAYSWRSNNVLELKIRYIDSPHTLYVQFQFEGDTVTAKLRDSFRPPNLTVIAKGRLIK